MLLITSAAYITPGLISEFGKLPPCMLPVQNKRLYEHQIALAKNSKSIYLSLPSSFELTEYDIRRLASLDVIVVKVPDGLSLGQSIVYVLNVAGNYDESLEILHGDTLFSILPDSKDVFAVADAEDGYEWASSGLPNKNIFSGYFSFSNQSLLIQKITECNYNFIDGIRMYSKEIKVAYQELPDWMDFGLANTYYRSISKMTTQRVFNSMKVTRYSVRKSSKDIRKMKAESNWMLSLPSQMKHYAPTVWDQGEENNCAFYEIEYYYLSSLANIFVFGKNKTYVWEEIINACVEYLDDEAKFKPNNTTLFSHQNNQLYAVKTLDRLDKYANQTGVSLDTQFKINGIDVPSLHDIIKDIDLYLTKDDDRFVTLMHGDPCFSNILYDFKSKSIKVIDPRGLDLDGNLSIYGDFRYDVGKLAHSIIGLYDFIICGMFNYKEHSTYDLELHFEVSDEILNVQKFFLSKKIGGYTSDQLGIYPVMIHLFLSMIPLHSDYPSRQKAMLANALRLYVEFKNK